MPSEPNLEQRGGAVLDIPLRRLLLASVFIAIPLGLGLIASDMLGDRWGTKSPPPGSKSPSPEGPFTSPLGSLALPAAGCGMPECHYESYQEWSVSKHRFSAVNLRYRESVDLLSRDQGWAATKLCMECHNPLLRFADRDESARGAEEDRLRNEGVTCVACHAVDLHGAQSGAASRVPLSHPKAYFPEVPEDQPGRDALVEDFTYLYVRPHRSSYVKKGRRSSELCAVCHAARPEGDPAYLRLHVGDVYASWRNSSAARAGFGCRECHMQMFDLNWEHPPWSHQFFGLDTNFSADLPEPWRGDAEIARAEKNVQEWLDGSLVVAPRLLRYLRMMGDPQPAAYEKHIRGLPILEMQIALKEGPDSSGRVTLEVVTSSRRLGHSFPAGLAPSALMWLELETETLGGTWQRIEGTQAPLEQALRRPAPLRSGDGDRNVHGDLRRHWLGGVPPASADAVRPFKPWEAKEREVMRVLHPNGSIQDDFAFDLGLDPPDVVRVRARWLYKRDGKAGSPVQTLAQSEKELAPRKGSF